MSVESLRNAYAAFRAGLESPTGLIAVAADALAGGEQTVAIAQLAALPTDSRRDDVLNSATDVATVYGWEPCSETDVAARALRHLLRQAPLGVEHLVEAVLAVWEVHQDAMLSDPTLARLVNLALDWHHEPDIRDNVSSSLLALARARKFLPIK
jgi:hypothetical protein